MQPTGSQARLNRFAVVDYHVTLGGVPLQPAAAIGGLGPVQEGRGDMDVRGVGSVSGAVPIRPTGGAPTTRDPQVKATQLPRDQLEISSAGKMLDQLSQNPDVRAERIARIKEAIANGTYDTDEKLEAALSRMFDSLSADLDNE